jgi:hypothetical protein
MYDPNVCPDFFTAEDADRIPAKDAERSNVFLCALSACPEILGGAFASVSSYALLHFRTFHYTFSV